MGMSRSVSFETRRLQLVRSIPAKLLRDWAIDVSAVDSYEVDALHKYIVAEWKKYQARIREYVNFCWENETG